MARLFSLSDIHMGQESPTSRPSRLSDEHERRACSHYQDIPPRVRSYDHAVSAASYSSHIMEAEAETCLR